MVKLNHEAFHCSKFIGIISIFYEKLIGISNLGATLRSSTRQCNDVFYASPKLLIEFIAFDMLIEKKSFLGDRDQPNHWILISYPSLFSLDLFRKSFDQKIDCIYLMIYGSAPKKWIVSSSNLFIWRIIWLRQ